MSYIIHKRLLKLNKYQIGHSTDRFLILKDLDQDVPGSVFLSGVELVSFVSSRSTVGRASLCHSQVCFFHTSNVFS